MTSSDSQVKSTDHYLYSLDGLRFFAAFFVVIAHSFNFLYKVATPPAWLNQVSTLSGLGMTLFFLLSGFVIHYNYHNLGQRRDGPAIRQFALARFSRLYPLFFAVVMIDLYQAHHQMPENYHRAWAVLPFYLTMTHDWFYMVNGNNSMIYQFNYLSSVSWSISAECFFYILYLFAAPLLIRIRKPLVIGAIGLAMFLLWTRGLYDFRTYYFSDFNNFGTNMFGPIADVNHGFQDSFVRWVEYFSPYARMMEFTLGCLTAQLYMLYRERPASIREMKWAGNLTILLVALQFAAHFYVYNWSYGYMGSLLYSPLTAALIFLLARYPGVSAVGRWLSSPRLVKGGEASYSIYLLHFYIFYSHARPAIPVGVDVSGLLLSKIFMTIILILCVARLSFVFFETPAKDLIRGRMRLSLWPMRIAGNIRHEWAFLALTVICHFAVNRLDHLIGHHLAA